MPSSGRFFLVVSITVLFPGFETSPKHNANISPEMTQFAAFSNQWALDMYKHLSSADRNIVFSPYNAYASIGMLLLGARESSAEDIRSSMGLMETNIGDNDIHAAFLTTSQLLKNRGTDKQALTSAHKLLVSSEFQIENNFSENLNFYYDAAAEGVDFDTDSVEIQNHTNAWLSAKLGHNFGIILENPPNVTTSMLLLDASYYKGTWKSKFSPQHTKPSWFYNSGLHGKNIYTMHLISDANYGFSRELDSQLLELPYAGGNMSMVFILPSERTGLSHLEQELTLSNLQEAIDSLSMTPAVYIKIPPFKLEETYNLNDYLQTTGMDELFSKEANFNGISLNPSLVLSDVIHKAVIEVNEDGIEQATVTLDAPSNQVPREPVIFYADHPFVFLVVDKLTQMFLYLGKVNRLSNGGH